MRWPLAVLAAAGITACAEEPPGALNPGVVSDLASEVGDARGVEPSGVYAVALTPEDCGCSDIHTSLWSLTLCQGGTFGPLGTGGTLQTTFEVVASDGVVDLASEAATANPVGPLDADGSFDAGVVTRLTSFAATGYQITRVDGTLEPLGDTDYEIEGRVQLRLIGRVELQGLENVVSEVQEVDCVETLNFSGDRYIVR